MRSHHKNSPRYKTQQQQFTDFTHEGKHANSQQKYEVSAMRQQRAALRMEPMAHAHTDIENTHSETAVGSLSAFQGGNMHEHRLHGYVNMDMTQSTPLDRFYPNPIPS